MGKAKKMARGEKFQFVGYYNCLDFVNTEFTKEGGRHIDSLLGFADLIDWLCESRLFNRRQVEFALNLWGSGDSAERVHQIALTLRKALLAMAKNLAARRPVPSASLQVINKTIGKCPARVLLACCSRETQRAIRGNDPTRSARARAVDGADRAVGQRSAVSRRPRARQTMRESRLRRLLLRHIEEPYSSLVLHHRMR
jgi:hypothetical protein